MAKIIADPDIGTDELCQLIAAISAEDPVLDLSNIHIARRSEKDILKIFAAVPVFINSFILSDPDWVYVPPNELVRIFASLPIGVSSLDLSSSGLASKNQNHLLQLIGAIPDRVNSINISDNQFLAHPQNIDKLINLVKALSPGVTSLNLSKNYLGYPHAPLENLLNFLSNIPDDVTFLDLSDNGIELYKEAEIAPILAALSNVDYVKIQENLTLDVSTILSDVLLNQIKSMVLTKDVRNCLMRPPFVINEKRCTRFITHYMQQGSPIADFTAALLLAGEIASTIEEKSSVEVHNDFVTTHLLDAIKLFDLASRDETLKPFTDFMLWHIKTVHNDITAIREALAFFNQTPSQSINSYSFFNVATSSEDEDGPSDSPECS